MGQVRLAGCVPRLDIPEMSLAEGAAAGARTLIIGAANRGGVVPPAWEQSLVEALSCGLDIANGLHVRLSEFDNVRNTAQQHVVNCTRFVTPRVRSRLVTVCGGVANVC